MGKYYALQQGEDASVAAAIEDHYRPKGPDDLVPAWRGPEPRREGKRPA